MKIIYLTQGYCTIVDDWHYHYLLAVSPWYATGKNLIYARRNIKGKFIYMQYEIVKRMGLIVPKGSTIDHKDRNGLNNLEENLRIATQSQQNVNQKRKDNQTRYKGVYRNYDKFIAQISVNGHVKHLGRFNTEEEAYEVYKKKAIEIYGEFVTLD